MDVNSGFDESSAFLQLQGKAVFSSFSILSKVCATVAGIGLNREPPIDPAFLGSAEFFLAIRAFDHFRFPSFYHSMCLIKGSMSMMESVYQKNAQFFA
jgi:hypothetical protein